MSKDPYDVIVIGAGPGGYVCAIRCAQLGMNVALIEKDAHMGGTCLNVGCIPSKALLHSTGLYHQAAHSEEHGLVIDHLRVDVGRLMKRKNAVVDQLRKGVEMLVRKRDIACFKGRGEFVSAKSVAIVEGKDAGTTLNGRHVVIATGSVSAGLPFLEADGKRVVTSTEALCFEEVPKRLLVIGAGAIGLELGSVWARLGAEVTFLEFLPTIAAGSDEDVSKLAERIFKKQGMTLHTSTRVTACEVHADRVVITAERKGSTVSYEAEKVLLAVGRRPHTSGLGLQRIGLELDPKGRIPVKACQTAVEGVWAIGDVIEGPMLAHKAEEEGVMVAEAIAGRAPHVDYSRVPNVIYTEPEIASVGLTERMAAEKGLAVKVGKFPLQANGRAIAQGATEGMAKIIADAKTDRILGAALIASGASEMIASVVAHMEYGGSAEDLAGTIHAHPTISESLKEAALAVDNRALHGL